MTDRATELLLRAEFILVGSGEVIPGGEVHVGPDGDITHVGRSLPTPDGVRILDLPGATVMPGLIDCHVHLAMDASPSWMQVAVGSPAELTLKAAHAARSTLLGGVTTARCLGAPHGVEIAVRNAIARDEIVGPRLLCAGSVICPTGGHGAWMGRVADGEDGVRAAVRAELAGGADIIKVMATGGVLTPGSRLGAAAYTSAELEACVDEAHRSGVPVVAHTLTRDGVLAAVLAGCDHIEHGDGTDEAIATLMAERGVYYGATLTSALDFLEHADRGAAPKWALDKLLKTAPARLNSFSIAAARGVRLVMSTDAGTPFHAHGRNAAEITAMVGQGLEPAAAIEAATTTGAEALGLGREIGSVEVSKRADLLVVRGNPLDDPSIFASPEAFLLVVKDGRIYRPDPADRAGTPVNARDAHLKE